MNILLLIGVNIAISNVNINRKHSFYIAAFEIFLLEKNVIMMQNQRRHFYNWYLIVHLKASNLINILRILKLQIFIKLLKALCAIHHSGFLKMYISLSSNMSRVLFRYFPHCFRSVFLLTECSRFSDFETSQILQ